VQRVGIEEGEAFLGRSWRSDTALLRRLEPHARFIYTMDQSHELATRWQHWATSLEFRDGSEMEIAWNPQFDELLETFVLDEGDSPEEQVVVRPGAYDIDQYYVRWEGNESRVVSESAHLERGDYFDGTYWTAELGAAARISRHARASVSAQRTEIDLPRREADPADPNVIALPESSFDFTLIQGRVGISFTTRVFLDGLLQYNTVEEDFSSNLRFNWKYRPGSDLYVVYTERRDIEGLPTDVADRSFAVKWTWLASF